MDYLVTWITHYGYIAIFFLLMLGIVGLPVPDEFLLTCTGYLISQKILTPVPSIFAAFFGTVCGITVSYLLGRLFGFPLIEKYGRLVNLKVEKIHRVRRWFERIGKWTLTVGYFFPGVRHFTGFAAGTSKLGAPVFAAYAYMGACSWSIVFLSLGFFLGEEWLAISERIHLYCFLGSLVLIAALGGYFLAWQKFTKPSISKR